MTTRNDQKSYIISKIQLVTIEPAVFLYQVSTFIQFGVMQDLIYTKVCLQSIFKESCSNLQNSSLDYVQEHGSYWMRYTDMAAFIPAIFSSLYMGSWCSDFGAKIPMLLSALGTVFSNIVNIILSIYKDSDINFLLIGQIAQGLLGGGIGFTIAINNYIVNISNIENRTMKIAILEAMLSFGATVGPLIGGVLMVTTNHAIVFLFMLILNIVIIVYIATCVKNINPQVDGSQPLAENDSKVKSKTIKSLFTVQRIVNTLKTCFRHRDYEGRKFLLIILLGSSVFMLCLAGEMDTTFLFVKDEPLKWDYTLYSYYYGLKPAMNGFSLMFLLPVIKYFFNPSDSILAFMGVISQAVSVLFLAFSTTTVMVFSAPLLSVFAGYMIPSVHSMYSKITEKSEHGNMFAVIAIIENICFLLASIIFNSIYPSCRKFLRGFVFILYAALEIFPAIAFGYLYLKMKRVSSKKFQRDNNTDVQFKENKEI